MRSKFLLSFFSIIPSLVQLYPGSAKTLVAGPPLKFRTFIPAIASCKQLVIVTTKDWDDVNATVQLYERVSGGGTNWRRWGYPFPAVVGQRGLAWGIGLHGCGKPGEPEKREGDKKAPAGVFRFGDVFGTARPEQVRFLRLPYRQVTAATEAVDDPRSRYYNQVVDRETVGHPDWVSSESMLQVRGRYRLGVTINHNVRAYPGFGSCIFFHVWDPGYPGTTGCTATGYVYLIRLLRWLDPKKNPLIVQLPLSQYHELKQRWNLPALREWQPAKNADRNNPRPRLRIAAGGEVWLERRRLRPNLAAHSPSFVAVLSVDVRCYPPQLANQ